jgi:hypothetical protein
VYEDDFADPASGWPNELVFDNYYIGYHEPEFYHVKVRAANDRAVVTVPEEQSFGDFVALIVCDTDPTVETGSTFRHGVCAKGRNVLLPISNRTRGE